VDVRSEPIVTAPVLRPGLNNRSIQAMRAIFPHGDALSAELSSPAGGVQVAVRRRLYESDQKLALVAVRQARLECLSRGGRSCRLVAPESRSS